VTTEGKKARQSCYRYRVKHQIK